jgi:hypothetical protein
MKYGEEAGKRVSGYVGQRDSGTAGQRETKRLLILSEAKDLLLFPGIS